MVYDLPEASYHHYVILLLHVPYSMLFAKRFQKFIYLHLCDRINRINADKWINADKLTSEIFVHKALHWALYHV